MEVQIKRGLKANLPILKDGEMAYTTDENGLYIGKNGENVKLNEQPGIPETPEFPTSIDCGTF